MAQRVLRLSSGRASDVVGWRALSEGSNGRDIDGLLNRRILIELPGAEHWSCCDRCEGDCEGRWIDRRDGKLSAVCPLDGTDRITLDPTDLRLFKIDPKQLAVAMQDDSGLAGYGPEALAEGVWSLGYTSHEAPPTLVVLAFECGFDVLPGMIDRLKRLAEPASVTVLTAGNLRLGARGHLENAGVKVMALAEAIDLDSSVRFRIRPEALAPQPVEAKLVIAEGARTVTVNGRTVCLNLKPFQLLLYLGRLAQRTDAWIEVRQIETEIWGRDAPTQGAINQIRRLRQAIAKGFPGATAPHIVETGANSYRIAPQYRPVAIAP